MAIVVGQCDELNYTKRNRKKRVIVKNSIFSIDKILYNKLYNIVVNKNKNKVKFVSNDGI
jgi:hypothetical protein